MCFLAICISLRNILSLLPQIVFFNIDPVTVCIFETIPCCHFDYKYFLIRWLSFWFCFYGWYFATLAIDIIRIYFHLALSFLTFWWDFDIWRLSFYFLLEQYDLLFQIIYITCLRWSRHETQISRNRKKKSRSPHICWFGCPFISFMFVLLLFVWSLSPRRKIFLISDFISANLLFNFSFFFL